MFRSRLFSGQHGFESHLHPVYVEFACSCCASIFSSRYSGPPCPPSLLPNTCTAPCPGCSPPYKDKRYGKWMKHYMQNFRIMESKVLENADSSGGSRLCCPNRTSSFFFLLFIISFILTSVLSFIFPIVIFLYLASTLFVCFFFFLLFPLQAYFK